jgi:TBC1 domain family member 8/9
MSLPLHLRTYQEPTKEDLSRAFFNLPPIDALYPSSTTNGDGSTGLIRLYSQTGRGGAGAGAGGSSDQAKVLSGITPMEVNAVLSVEGKDEVYVSKDRRVDVVSDS